MKPSPEPDRPRLSIRVLGPVEVRVGEVPITVDTRKAIALLCYLALSARPVSRAVIAAFLWPESDDADARSALRRTLSVLNAAVGGVGLIVDRSSVALEPEVVDLDLDRFRSCLGRARSHGHAPDRPCGECRAALEEAVALDRGPFMEGFSLRDSEPWDEWHAAEQAAQQRDLAAALERLVLERSAAGSWDGAVAGARRWVELDPLHEPAHRALMEAYARAGETTAAIRQYRVAAATLERDLGVAPLSETTALYDAIVAGTLARTAPEESAVSRAAEALPKRTAPPLVGRGAELARMLAELDGLETDGRVLIVEGEAGIGKSRLADAFVERAAAQGHRVISARCYEGEEAIPLAPIVALLRAGLAGVEVPAALAMLPTRSAHVLAGMLPELEPLLGAAPRAPDRSPSARLALLEAIAAGLSVAAGTTFGAHDAPASTTLAPVGDRPAPIVRLDDLQWADDTSLDALAYLARRLQGTPLLVLLSWRREELGERARPLAAETDRQPGRLLRLGRLSAADTRDLVQTLVVERQVPASVETVSRLVDEAEGLPLYVVEAIGAGDASFGAIPVGIRDLLGSRLAALSDLAAQVAAAAAVIGRSFGSAAVRAVSGRSEEEVVEALEELAERGIVRESRGDRTGEYDFAHASLREVAYASTSAARRRLLHRRAADAYRAKAVGEIDPLARLVRMAQHERAAGRDDGAAQAFGEAGELALALSADPEALEHFEAALALGHPDSVAIHVVIAHIRSRLGAYAGAIAALETAAATAPPGQLAEIEHHLGRIHLRRGDPRAAAAHLRAALDVLDDMPATVQPLRSRVLADHAVAAARAGDGAAALELAGAARDLAGDDVAAQAEAERILGLLAREQGDLEQARDRIERSLALATRLSDPAAAIAAANALALVVAAQGSLAEALDLGQGALLAARRAGERHLQAAVESNLADILREAGQREEAMAHLKASAALYAEIGGDDELPEPGIWMLQTW